MNLQLTFILAGLAGLANLIAILNWLDVGPRKLFNSEWWKAREVTVSRGKLATIALLGFLSLAFSSYGFYVINRQSPIPKIIAWGVAAQHCNVLVDTTPIKIFSGDYDVVLACGVVDPTVDMLEDTRIIMSGPFGIYGGNQAISAASTPEFTKFIESLGNNVSVSVWQKVFLIPKDRNVTEIHKLSDVPRIKGRLFQ